MDTDKTFSVSFTDSIVCTPILTINFGHPDWYSMAVCLLFSALFIIKCVSVWSYLQMLMYTGILFYVISLQRVLWMLIDAFIFYMLLTWVLVRFMIRLCVLSCFVCPCFALQIIVHLNRCKLSFSSADNPAAVLISPATLLINCCNELKIDDTFARCEYVD